MKFKRIAALAVALVMCFSLLGELPLSGLMSFTAAGASTSQTKAKATMSKSAKSSLKKLRKKIGKANKSVGLAFVGYVNSKNSKKQLRKYVKKSKLAKTYPFLSEVSAKNYASTGGAELFALVPQNNKVSFTLYKSSVTNKGTYKNAKKPFYTGKPGEVILLCCNPSEIYSDVLIVATVGKKKIKFRPVVSLKNGKLAKNKRYYDFSVYSKKKPPKKDNEADIEKSIYFCYEILFGYKEIRYYMDRGMILTYTGRQEIINGGPCWIFALGKDDKDHFVTERLYGVCDNLVYAYDAVNDSWYVLGMG